MTRFVSGAVLALAACAFFAVSAQAQNDDDKFCIHIGAQSCSTDGYLDTCVDYGFSMQWEGKGETCTPVGIAKGDDASNSDPKSAGVMCKGAGANDVMARGAAATCKLAEAATFTLVAGPNVPADRRARGANDAACKAGEDATFYSNGRLRGCVLSRDAMFMDGNGKMKGVNAGEFAGFDPEGRLAVHQNP